MKEESQKITGEVKTSQTSYKIIKEEIKNIFGLKEKTEQAFSKRITEFLEIILGGSINLNASDLHIEPREDSARLRIRIDGLLQDVLNFDSDIYQRLSNRIKLISGLKLNISDRPQDGRFSFLFGEQHIEIRTSSIPAEHGESFVLRILNPKNLLDMKTLGVRKDLLDLFYQEIKKPNGMIIVTGTTGSGKTTTLYAFLEELRKPEVKIITIEDPIEYHLEGISQTQVNPRKGYDFANGLKSIVRQDPDVILVGEIRDLETVQIALQAALTGHLVFTTLHTNDAAGTIARLVSLGAKLANIGPAINMAIAQRLVRKVCKKCSRLRNVSLQELNKLKQELSVVPENFKIPEINENLQIAQAVGCDSCNNTGFKGRTGIFEGFSIDDEIEKFILNSPSIAALREKITKRGMLSMRQDGFIKVLEGITTIEEIERVT